MKAIMIIPENSNEGNVIWQPPYLYPEEQLIEAINGLKTDGFQIESLENDIGLAFVSNYNFEEMRRKVCNAFRWMDIKCYRDENKINFEEDVLDHAIVVLPLTRLQIETPIISKHICLFPAYDFWIYNVCDLTGEPFENSKSNLLRDVITKATQIFVDVFHENPVMVFTLNITRENYLKLNHKEDVELIKKCSRKAEDVMDLLRFHSTDFIFPEFLPAKAGLWNDRYSAMYIYFPKFQIGHIQSREVELKTFIKGIGMDFHETSLISLHPLLSKQTNSFQNIIKHALRLYTNIQESDNETMKFTQIMTLFEYIGDPNAYGLFKDMKNRFLGVLAKDKQHYEMLSNRFMELTHGTKDNEGNYHIGLRTAIVHLGNAIEDLVSRANERKELFKELYSYIYILIRDMMFSKAMTWEEYESERTIKREKILSR